MCFLGSEHSRPEVTSSREERDIVYLRNLKPAFYGFTIEAAPAEVSSWFWSLLISVLIPHLHATWCCPVSPSFLYPPFQSDNTCWYPPCSLTLLYTYHLAYHLQTWLSFLCILKSTQTGLKALIWCYCDHNVIATPTYLNTLVQSQLDIGWASPFSVKLWPNSDPTWRLMVLTLRTA